MRNPLTPTAVTAYLAAGHTQAQAALHFGVSDRTIRTYKQRACPAPRRRLRRARRGPLRRPEPPLVPLTTARRFIPQPALITARHATMWIGWDGELHRVPAGTSGATWNALQRVAMLRQARPETSEPEGPETDPEALPVEPEFPEAEAPIAPAVPLPVRSGVTLPPPDPVKPFAVRVLLWVWSVHPVWWALLLAAWLIWMAFG